ncbi:F0F1 ATP synthase subunit B [Pseudonocardia lutea]|jgi:F-type H+-transporting ATPase subunit b|uniref:ATP synthase subunit b n=1 Tax=Pseudonocardia lutea TaxID=2172015 RepID=A0ABW1I383_9PSEU
MTIAAEELNPLVPHLTEIIVGLIAFGLLFWVLAKTVFPQFEKLYAERTDQIEGGLKRAEQAQAEADALKKQYEDQLAGARAEAARIRDDARAEGQQIKAELRAEAEEEAARIRARAEEQVTAQRSAAERSLRGEIGGLSAELAERILGSELADPRRRSATVDSFLSELDAMAPRQTTGVR